MYILIIHLNLIILFSSLLTSSLWFLSYPICLQDKWHKHWCHLSLNREFPQLPGNSGPRLVIIDCFVSELIMIILNGILLIGGIVHEVDCEDLVKWVDRDIVDALCFLHRWRSLMYLFKCLKSWRTAVSLPLHTWLFICFLFLLLVLLFLFCYKCKSAGKIWGLKCDYSQPASQPANKQNG